MRKKINTFLFTILLTFCLISINVIPVLATTISDVICFYSPKIIHITNDSNLKTYLASTENGSLIISKNVKKNYSIKFKKEINITESSIAVEIVGHVYPDKIAKYLPFGLGNFITKHTKIIDIGEKSVDSNRWIWDSIAAVIDSHHFTNKYISFARFPNNEERHIDDIIKDPKNSSLNLNKEIMIKIEKDIDNGTIDPILFKIINQ